MLHYKIPCKSCGQDFHLTDEQVYGEDGSPDYMGTKLCPQCYYDTEQAERVKLISDFLDTLNETQRDSFSKILEKVLDRDIFWEMKELIDVHFQGYEGIRSWGLW